MDKIKENLGILIREAREKAGLTQYELSEELGLGDKTILNIENFRGNPKFDSLYPLVNFLKIPGDKLFYPDIEEHEANKQQLAATTKPLNFFELYAICSKYSADSLLILNSQNQSHRLTIFHR